MNICVFCIFVYSIIVCILDAVFTCNISYVYVACYGRRGIFAQINSALHSKIAEYKTFGAKQVLDTI